MKQDLNKMPTLKSYTFASHTSQPTSQSLQKSMPFQPHRHSDITDRQTTKDRRAACNSTYKKLAVQWLNEVQFFNQNFVQVDSFELRNRQLLIAANRYTSS
jgi:hypothetical protein